MLKKMASKSILLLSIFLVVATNVFSFDDEDMKVVVNSSPANPSVVSVAAAVKLPPFLGKAPPPDKAPAQPPASPLAPSPASMIKSLKDCIPLCFHRCKFHLLKKLCTRSCMLCCDRCKCVPPGYFGNRRKCGKCYTDITHRNNSLRCP